MRLIHYFSILAISLPRGMASSSTAGKVDQGGSHAQRCSYWLEDISHQGTAAFNDYPANFRVFRNVKDFGAKGDGVTDDTSAINYAIGSDNTCAPGSCFSSTVSWNARQPNAHGEPSDAL
jgi:Endopolygalacturonase